MSTGVHKQETLGGELLNVGVCAHSASLVMPSKLVSKVLPLIGSPNTAVSKYWLSGFFSSPCHCQMKVPTTWWCEVVLPAVTTNEAQDSHLY